MSEDQIPDFSTSTLFNVSGKVALVTGGGTGIGRMIATALVQNGARVYIASRKLSTISSTAESLTKLGPGTCTALESNLQSRADCKALAQQLVNKGEKKLHLLINNAGMTWGFNMSDQNEKLESAAWDRLFALNVKFEHEIRTGILTAHFRTLPLLEAGSNGNIDPARVINVSSVAGLSAIAEDPLSAPGNGTWSCK
ncbi:hypothetical protein HK097_003452 [Rhizophlyctis rosea]|uniref:Uncharacterized protein n=1 Tax=Rhizophlyctis rosea TaxID=64517 RepID=A0AAD5SFK8_9FUNG|nr:hypothetical protein HK097_003452 [Rhizophlyctis rosea]